MAEVLQDLISKNARENEVEDRSMDYPVARDEEEEDEVEEDPEVSGHKSLDLAHLHVQS